MAFGMFSAQCSPIAIDFGSSSVKMLQIGTGERPPLIAAAELALPPGHNKSPDEQFELYARQLPKLLREGRFKGRRAVCSVPCGQTLIQHMQMNAADGVDRVELVKAQLQNQFGWAPGAVVVRTQEVTETHRDGQARVETICLAMTRDIVMRHVALLQKCKLEVVGVHSEIMAIVRAFDHLHRREGDDKLTTMYIDLGYGGTKVAIGHGKQMAFAKCIQIGGRNLDQLIADTLRCDLASAKAHRLSQETALTARGAAAPAAVGRKSQAGEELPAVLRAAMTQAAHEEGARSAKAGGGDAAGNAATGAGAATVVERRMGQAPAELSESVEPGRGPRPPAHVDFGELLEAISDELSMCLRYHQSLFPGRALDRVVFLGGEARQIGLCRHIAQVLRVPAQLGDPLARLMTAGTPQTPGLTLGQPQPGWAVPFGLCATPTDL